VSDCVESAGVYVLGFAEFLAGLITRHDGYELVEPARTGSDCTDARFTIRNAIGETFAVDIEHVRGLAR
jgi:hypothetical protein